EDEGYMQLNQLEGSSMVSDPHHDEAEHELADEDHADQPMKDDHRPAIAGGGIGDGCLHGRRTLVAPDFFHSVPHPVRRVDPQNGSGWGLRRALSRLSAHPEEI